MQTITRLGAMALAASGFMFTPAANAQQDQPSSAPSITAPSPTNPSRNISDNKLDAAAAAVKSVSVIRSGFEQKLAQAPDTDKDRLVDEADNAMTKAVTDQGLSVEEYSTIMKLAQNDSVVRDKLLQRLK
jgi:glucose/arabinose dehydrogenase